MSENISEHTTSITGLTCKPLAILSETISIQEMNMARGGGGNNKCEDEDPPDWNTGPTFQDIINSLFGFPEPGLPQSPNFGDNGPQISPTEMYPQGDPLPDWTQINQPPNPDATEDFFYSDQMAGPEDGNSGNCDEGEDDNQNCEYCDDENCDGDCANDDDGDDGGDDGLFGDFATTGQDNTKVGN